MTTDPKLPVLALDFDGVICCSAGEVLLTGLEAYVDMVPSSRFVETLSRFHGTSALDAALIEQDEFSRAFQPLVPLGNRAEDFGVALCALERGAKLIDQQAYDEFYRSLDSDWLSAFHEAFYRCRATSRDQDQASWLRLHRAYEPFVDILHRNCSKMTLAIATAKDECSVRLLLDFFGISDLFTDELILDKDTAIEKQVHLSLIAERTGADMHRITFVDDKVNHLEGVQHLGVRLVLASWGYNTSREVARAEELGFAVATLDTAEPTLFGGTG
ncbi:MAG: hypothetical protein GY906_02035 [bacterium]|nr:hypothetical protein [bacterium]